MKVSCERLGLDLDRALHLRLAGDTAMSHRIGDYAGFLEDWDDARDQEQADLLEESEGMGPWPMSSPEKFAANLEAFDRARRLLDEEARASQAYLRAMDPVYGVFGALSDWIPTIDPARRLFQVRLAVEVLHLPEAHRVGMEELASNLEHKLNRPEGQRK